MLSEPPDLVVEQVAAWLAEYWAIDAADICYSALGHGAHHWTVTQPDGIRWFVTADSRVGESFRAMQESYRLAARLHREGLEFVHAAIPSRSGDLWQRVSPTWSMAVFEHLEGRNPDYRTDERAQVAELVGRLHSFRPRSDGIRRWELECNPELLGELLAALDTPWSSGPFGERARALFATSRTGIEALLRHLEILVAQLDASDDPWVITHGEPHAGDAIVDTSGHFHMIDWDATCLAPRERDLRILLYGDHPSALGWDDRDVVAAYRRTAGPVEPRSFVLELFRAEWTLMEIVNYGQQFRGPHEDSEDMRAHWYWLNRYIPVAQNWPDLT